MPGKSEYTQRKTKQTNKEMINEGRRGRGGMRGMSVDAPRHREGHSTPHARAAANSHAVTLRDKSKLDIRRGSALLRRKGIHRLRVDAPVRLDTAATEEERESGRAGEGEEWPS